MSYGKLGETVVYLPCANRQFCLFFIFMFMLWQSTLTSCLPFALRSCVWGGAGWVLRLRSPMVGTGDTDTCWGAPQPEKGDFVPVWDQRQVVWERCQGTPGYSLPRAPCPRCSGFYPWMMKPPPYTCPSLYDLLSFPSLRTACLLLVSLLFLEHNQLLVLSTIWIESSKRVFGNSRLAGKTCGPEKNKKIYIHIHIYTYIHTHMYAFIHIHVRERESLPTSLMWVCVCIFLAGCMWLCVHILCSRSRPDSSILLYSWAHLKLGYLGHKIIPAEWVAGLGKPSICPSVQHTLH